MTLVDMPRRAATGRLAHWQEKLNKLGSKSQQDVLIIFAADNGISIEHCSIYKPMQSALIVQEHLNEQSPTSRLLKTMQTREIIVDVGLATPVDDIRILNRNIRRGSRNFLQEDALEEDEVIRAIETGAELWDEISCSDFDIIAVGEIGISNTLCAAAIASALCGLHPNDLTGKGSGDSKVIAKKVDIICKAMVQRKPDSASIIDILMRFGGLEIAALTGFISRAQEKNNLLMLDGYVTSVAALLASITEPGVVECLLAPSLSDQTGHRFILGRLGLDFLFDMDINYGEGLAAVLGLYLARLITLL
ncbi:MAG: nicotinate-nucleotide--dimethylbenzimidazole phosphoribosyltransferase [Syntrophomonadaceae bacterium]|nr:nicotinate-nucleotide--dimethylbenzimidazole phosphoribosyltransferase [Syntrophomonadaceae bacterium]